jgi:hypothetical protein
MAVGAGVAALTTDADEDISPIVEIPGVRFHSPACARLS